MRGSLNIEHEISMSRNWDSSTKTDSLLHVIPDGVNQSSGEMIHHEEYLNFARWILGEGFQKKSDSG